jgi:hypothetical protein
MTDYKVWVDLDGVFANWLKAACAVYGQEYPISTVIHREWLQEKTGDPVITMLEKLDRHPRFWEDMEPHPLLPDLLTYFDTTFPDWGILSKPTIYPSSWSGKASWVRRYMGEAGLHRLCLYAGPKHHLATPTSVLVDDTAYQVDGWTRAGGKAFRWREYSADCLDHYYAQFQDMQVYLKQFAPTKLKVKK